MLTRGYQPSMGHLQDASRAGFIQAMESLHNYQMGGFKVDFSAQEHNGSNYVDLTFLGSQEWQP